MGRSLILGFGCGGFLGFGLSTCEVGHSLTVGLKPPSFPPLFGIPRADRGDGSFCQGKSNPIVPGLRVPAHKP